MTEILKIIIIISFGIRKNIDISPILKNGRGYGAKMIFLNFSLLKKPSIIGRKWNKSTITILFPSDYFDSRSKVVVSAL